jgi:hypothetical protein
MCENLFAFVDVCCLDISKRPIRGAEEVFVRAGAADKKGKRTERQFSFLYFISQ